MQQIPYGIIININQLDLSAEFKFSPKISINAVVRPHAGHLILKINFQIQGMHMSISVVYFKKEEKRM